MNSLSTHVLDTSQGRPAAHMAVTLYSCDATGWKELASAKTNTDGRIPALVPREVGLRAGRYRLVFDTGAYFQSQGAKGFYPEVAVVFEVVSTAEHYHVPLLISPYGYSTYRGS